MYLKTTQSGVCVYACIAGCVCALTYEGGKIGVWVFARDASNVGS